MRTSPASGVLRPLVEQDHPVDRRVEEPPPGGAGSRAWAAVQHQRRLAERVAATLPVDAVAVANVEHACANGSISEYRRIISVIQPSTCSPRTPFLPPEEVASPRRIE
jgi:hypothetical protein